MHAAAERGCAGERLVLLPDRAVWLPEHHTLLVADAHVGKAVSFRRLGVPVPSGTTSDTLLRLGRLLSALGARRLVILGDFLHSADAQSTATMAALLLWRRKHAAVRMTLVRGNHDARAGDPPPSLEIDIVDEPLRLGGLALCHHPQAVPGAYVLAGHWHPCERLSGRAGDRIRLPCFWLGDEAVRPVGVLPAFGAFTGMHVMPQEPGDRVYVVAGDEVRALNSGP
jgi:DNA ligase-associated metallophosphoesterase